MRRFRSKLWTIVAITVVMAMVVTGCGNTGGEKQDGESTAKGETIDIGVFNWAENIAAVNLWKLVLEEEGYDVKLIEGEKQPLFAAVASGDLDLACEVWLPNTDEPFAEKYKGNGWEVLEPWYEGTYLGLVVPEYVEIDSITELNANKDKYIVNGEPSIVGIDGGASLMRMTEEAIKSYDLDLRLIESSGPAMTATLKQSIEEKKPVVVTLWSPHWAFADFDLKYLEDPEGIYGEKEKIYPVGHEGFSEKYPTVTKWLNNWHMDDQSLGSLMSTINDAGDPAEGAKIWLEENRDLVNEWLEK